MELGWGQETVVCLVGPERAARREFTRALEGAGLSVCTCEDLGFETLGDSLESTIECLVLEYVHNRDSLGAIAALGEEWSDLPIVVLGPDDARIAGDVVAAGAAEYVPREAPDVSELLRERVHSAVESSRQPSGSPDSSPRRTTADGGEPVSTLDSTEESRLKERAMDEAPVGITIADADRPDTPLIYANAAFERVTGYPPEKTLERNCRFLQGPETDPDAVQKLRDAIERETPVTVELKNYRKDGSPFWNEVTLAPVRNPDGDVTHFVGFQDDVTERKEAQRALERERRSLDHLLERINGLLGSVHRELVEARSREEIESVVADRIAREEIYSWCWIARPDTARNALEVTAGAGSMDPPGEDFEASLTDDTGAEDSQLSRLLTTAFQNQEVEILESPGALEAITGSADSGLAGIAAIPIAYWDTCYGVVTIASTDPEALEEREVVVLEAIARSTATAINAIERGRLLSTDAVTEIEFDLRDRDLFAVELSASLETEVVYEGAVFNDDGSGQLFCTVDADPEAVEEALEALDVEARIVTAFEDSALIAASVGADSIVGRLAERGGTIRSMVAEDGVCTLSVEIPASTDARAVVTRLEERHPSIEMRSFRERDRPPATRQAFVEELRDRLTERQRTALTVAHASGFYEWNRSVSGDELAESMGITRSTFHQHRRAAERKLIGAVLDG